MSTLGTALELVLRGGKGFNRWRKRRKARKALRRGELAFDILEPLEDIPAERTVNMKGWRTVLFGVATVGLGVLQSAEVTNLVAQYPGTFATVVGVLILVFRFVTDSAVFRS